MTESNTGQAIPAEMLIGAKLVEGWRVTERVRRAADATGGHFSVCYIIERDNGERAFLKALDYSKAPLLGVRLADALQAMTSAYLWERDIVDACAASKMSNVVRGIASGEYVVKGQGLLSQVDYLIFEMAECDSRAYLDSMQDLDIAWALRCLHNIANGLRQLHQDGIAHQDLKPSNVLVYEEATKIGDLGRAARDDQQSPHEPNMVPGDHGYAPPELLYGHPMENARVQRRAADAYHLGSMMHSLFRKTPLTGEYRARMAPQTWYDQWDGGFEKAMPFLQHAFAEILQGFSTSLPTSIDDDLTKVFRQLGEPDPRLRGHPRSREGSLDRCSVERYVSHFDRLASLAELRLRR